MDGSPSGSSNRGILWARILEWVAIRFSRDHPTQGSNLGLLHGRWILHHLSHQRSPSTYLLGKSRTSDLRPLTFTFFSLTIALLLLLLSHFNRVRLCATPWTAACQAPPPMGFSRQEYWNGVPSPSPIALLALSISSPFILL